FDCMNSGVTFGPKPRGCVPYEVEPDAAHIPVRSSEPSGSTTSSPATDAAWSPNSVEPKPWSSVLPTTEPQPRLGEDDHQAPPVASAYSTRSKKRTPGSTTT